MNAVDLWGGNPIIKLSFSSMASNVAFLAAEISDYKLDCTRTVENYAGFLRGVIILV
jgi:hypothetical protein